MQSIAIFISGVALSVLIAGGILASLSKFSSEERVPTSPIRETVPPSSTPPKKPGLLTVSLPPVIGENQAGWSTRVPFANTTDRRIRIETIEKSCGCLGAELDKAELEPGETTHLTLRANLTGRSGKQTFLATLVEEKGNSLTVQVQIEVFDRIRVLLNGDASHQLPEMEALQTSEGRLDVEVYAESESNFIELGIPTPVGADWSLTREAERIERLEGGLWRKTVSFAYRLVSTTNAGQWNFSLNVPYTSAGAKESKAVSFVGKIQPQLVATPDYLHFSGEAEQPLVKKLFVRSQKSEPFRILEISGLPEGFTLEFDREAAKSTHVLTCRCDLKIRTDFVAAEVFLRTDVVKQPVVRIPVTFVPKVIASSTGERR